MMEKNTCFKKILFDGTYKSGSPFMILFVKKNEISDIILQFLSFFATYNQKVLFYFHENLSFPNILLSI